MIILALDQATQTGWAAGDQTAFANQTVDHGVFRMPKRPNLGERLISFEDQLNERIEFFEPELIAYEQPYWPAPGGSAGVDPDYAVSLLKQVVGSKIVPQRAEVMLREKSEKRKAPRISAEVLQFLQKVEGIVQLRAARRAIPVECYRSTTWRKTALGHGFPDEPKKAMFRRARALGYAVQTEDEAEAIGILMHALHGSAANERAQGDLLERVKETL